MKAVLINDEIAYIGELLDGIIIPINRELSIKKSGTNYELLQYVYSCEGVNRSNLSMIKFQYFMDEKNNRFASPRELAIIKHRGDFKKIASILSHEYNVKISIIEYSKQNIDNMKYFKIKYEDGHEMTLIDRKMIRAMVPINNELKLEYFGTETYSLIYPYKNKNSDGFIINFQNETNFNILAIKYFYNPNKLLATLKKEYNINIDYEVYLVI